MSSKSTIYTAMFIGSSTFGLIPLLWGDSALSLSAVVLSAVGGFAGIAIGHKMTH